MAPFASDPVFIPNKAGERIRERTLSMRFNGTVKFYNQSRGYGFIARDDNSKDVFVHAKALERSGIPAIDEGDKVSFEIEDDPRGRGKQAANLQLG
jgi:CspA family cold shock protein